MTSVDTSSRDSLAASFKKLPVDDQIAALGYIYQEVGASLPAASSMTSDKVRAIVKHVEEMRDGSQIAFLQDVLSGDRDEVALDPHPSKALAELIPGDGDEPPISEYHKLNPTERLAVWYNLASKMGNGVVAIPSDYAPSAQTQELLNALKSLSADEKLQFLTQVI